MNIYCRYSAGHRDTVRLCLQNLVSHGHSVSDCYGQNWNDSVHKSTLPDYLILFWDSSLGTDLTAQTEAYQAADRNMLVCVALEPNSLPDGLRKNAEYCLDGEDVDENKLAQVLELLTYKSKSISQAARPLAPGDSDRVARRIVERLADQRTYAEANADDWYQGRLQSMWSAERATILFGDWIVVPASNELQRGENKQRLTKTAMQVLTVILAHNGQVASKEILLSEVWGQAIVGDNALHQAISKIRLALGDETKHPAYVESISGMGYRALKPVSGIDGR